VVAEKNEKFEIYADSVGTEMGTIQISDEGLVIKTKNEGSMMVPFNYVESIKSDKGISLGKVKATLVFFDVMGEKHELTFMVSDMKLGALKKACEK
jgi:hypothetical protein